MTEQKQTVSVTVQIDADGQRRGYKFAMPMDVALDRGDLSADAYAAISEKTRELTGDLDQKGQRQARLSDLLNGAGDAPTE